MERTAVIRLPRDGMFYRRSDITAAVESRVNINNIAAFILTIIMRFGYSISESIQGEWIVVIFIVAGFIYLIATIISPLSVNWKTTCVGRLFFFTDTASKIKFVGARGMCEVKDQPASVEFTSGDTSAMYAARADVRTKLSYLLRKEGVKVVRTMLYEVDKEF